ncbi:hypothetical protein PHMEG_00027013 [Phytophthora megakarya]|uniref:Helitron helicase n=1 Tax=Phytophthora megakarya TaxID=4795 RepID=A0A225V9L7_9STRA|nr:hypothetical protein PHMEG_00027013 [Phytophthora megakarya]
MIHGPCGRGINSPGTGEDGVCSKLFHKAFLDDTRSWPAGPIQRRKTAQTYFNYNDVALDSSHQCKQTTITHRIRSS